MGDAARDSDGWARGDGMRGTRVKRGEEGEPGLGGESAGVLFAGLSSIIMMPMKIE